ncbi:MAG: stage III sporulation protein AF [Christensenellales bacterium]
MESFILSWAASVAAAVLIGTIIGMLLPESGIKKYVSVVTGIVVSMIILAPAAKLLSGTDVSQTLDDAFSTIEKGEVFDYDSAHYKDYIYRLYEVYIVNGQNKNE